MRLNCVKIIEYEPKFSEVMQTRKGKGELRGFKQRSRRLQTEEAEEDLLTMAIFNAVLDF